MGDGLASGHRWFFKAPRAELRARALSGELDVSRPDLGVSGLEINRKKCPGRILGVISCTKNGIGQSVRQDAELGDLPPRQLADAYVRGGDLVAAYRSTEAWPYATQIYWQVSDAGDSPDLMSSMSLLVSLQTHLLDTWPTMCIDTQLEADEILHVDCASQHEEAIHVLPRGTTTIHSSAGACSILYRLAGMPISYAEMMPASDLREITISRDNNRMSHARWALFAEFLEKGVIRRARMLSILVPRERDTELARAACSELEHRPLPLTT
jgi:hypothetical protein